MKIRAASETDRMAVAAVQAASWKDAYRGILPDDCLDNRVTGELARHWREIEIRAEDVVLVADEGEFIGFIAIWCRLEPFIDNLHVLPERRSKGIGGRLMAVAAQMLLR